MNETFNSYYSSIKFTNEYTEDSDYAYVNDYNTTGQQLVDLIQQKWKIDVPKLVINVLGSENSGYLPSNVRKCFRKGIIKSAGFTRGMIFTDGSNSGISRHIGAAKRQFSNISKFTTNIPVIGFNTFRKVHLGNELFSHLNNF